MLPIETINAVFPISVRLGATRVGPMTLKHAVVLEALGVSVSSTNQNTPEKSAFACWILSKRVSELDSLMAGDIKGLETWLSANKVSASDSYDALSKILASTFSTYVEPADDGTIKFDDLPDGYGWPLEMAETVAHEHGISFQAAIETPVSTVFALLAVMRQRYGAKSGGLDYYDRIRSKAFVANIRARAKKEKEAKAKEMEK